MKIRRIMAPTDFSAASMRAVDGAVDLAREFGAEVIPFFVQEPPYVGLDVDPYGFSPTLRPFLTARQRVARGQMSALRASIRERGVRCRGLVGEGRPAAEILTAARKLNVDLIVMATQGRTGAGRFFLGSVAAKVLRGARCPVLTVRIGDASLRRGGRARLELPPA